MSVAAVINSWLRSSESSPSRVASSQSGRSAGRVAPEVKRNWMIRRCGMATILSEMGHPTANAQPAKDFRRAASASNPRTEGNHLSFPQPRGLTASIRNRAATPNAVRLLRAPDRRPKDLRRS